MSADETVTLIAALVAGDRWLAADSCAVYLGLVTPDGKPNRRRFLERIASRPDFPKANPVTGTWKKSQVDDWADEQQRSA